MIQLMRWQRYCFILGLWLVGYGLSAGNSRPVLMLSGVAFGVGWTMVAFWWRYL